MKIWNRAQRVFIELIPNKLMTEKTPHILITGASGFIGTALLEAWHPQRSVVAMSRKKFEIAAPCVQGDFTSFESLRRLDDFQICGLIHLGAITGACLEEDGIGVNVAGTRRLLRYLIDRGCRKFVFASSIAATGCLAPDFVPQHLPMSATHPCLARDVYGMSKGLMEEMVRYFGRTETNCAFTLLRLGSVAPENWQPPKIGNDANLTIPFAQLARVYVSDVVRAFTLAIDAPIQSSARAYNIVATESSCGGATREVLCAHFGEKLNHIDWSHYAEDGHEHDAVYEMQTIREDLNFAPRRATRYQGV